MIEFQSIFSDFRILSLEASFKGFQDSGDGFTRIKELRKSSNRLLMGLNGIETQRKTFIALF